MDVYALLCEQHVLLCYACYAIICYYMLLCAILCYAMLAMLASLVVELVQEQQQQNRTTIHIICPDHNTTQHGIRGGSMDTVSCI